MRRLVAVTLVMLSALVLPRAASAGASTDAALEQRLREQAA